MAVEQNETVATKVVSSLDTSLNELSQITLTTIYNKFPQLGYSIFGITYGQIVAAVFIFLFILFIRPLIVKMIISILLRVAQKTKSKYDDRVIKNIEKPIRFSFLILALYIFVSILYLHNDLINKSLASLAIFNFFWFLLAIVNGISGVIYKATHKLYSEISDSLAKFIIRIVQIVIWTLMASSILSLWGINVTALLASLGIGGLAFALAAKDTAANLFGSIAILIDKSVKIGDWVKVDGVEGIVEDVGMRTTKIRTFKKSLVAIPNSIVANTHIENFSRRDIRRIKLRVGLTYNTTKEQLENIVKDIKELLQNHSGIAQDETMLVNFDNFGDSAKEIFIYTFTNTAVWQEYLDIKEDVYYKIEQIVQKYGSDFAFPSQSLYVDREFTKRDILKPT